MSIRAQIIGGTFGALALIVLALAIKLGSPRSDYQRLNRLEAHVTQLQVLVADHLVKAERELKAEVEGLRARFLEEED